MTPFSRLVLVDAKSTIRQAMEQMLKSSVSSAPVFYDDDTKDDIAPGSGTRYYVGFVDVGDIAKVVVSGRLTAGADGMLSSLIENSLPLTIAQRCKNHPQALPLLAPG